MSMRRPPIISLMGPPGSGKGTYGALLASRFTGASSLSIGDVLRKRSARDERLGAVLKSGALVDDVIVNDAVIQSLEDRSRDETNLGRGGLLILDGYPRNNAQASLLANWPVGLRPSFAIQFDVPDEICVAKLLGRRKCSICNASFNIKGVDTGGFDMPPILPEASVCKVRCDPRTDWKGRDDDTADTIKRRMEIYHSETKPVLRYWNAMGKLLRFVPFKGVKDMDKLVSLVENHLEGLVSK